MSDKEIRKTIKNITGENTQDNNTEENINNLLGYINDIKKSKRLELDDDKKHISNYKNIIKTYLQKIYDTKSIDYRTWY